MTTEYSSPAAPYLKSFSRVLIIIVFAVGMMVLIGWTFYIEAFKRPTTDIVPMNPLSAICFLLCALSLWLQRNEDSKPEEIKRAKRIALVVALIGAGKLISMLLRIDFRLDTFLFHDQLFDPSRSDIKRMAPNSAFCFLLTGYSLYKFDLEIFKTKRPAQYLAFTIMFISLLSLYGYAFGARFLYGVAQYIPMSVYSALNFFLISIAMLFARPEKGSMLILIGDTATEVTFLRLAAFIIPLVTGWLKIEGERRGYFSTEFGTALFAVVTYALAMFLLGRRSVVNFKLRAVRREADRAVRENERKLQSILDHSPTTIYIKNIEGKYELVNKQFEKLFHVRQNEVIGRFDHDIFPGDVATGFTNTDAEVKEKLQTIYHEEQISFENESPAFYLTAKFPLTDADGKIHSICGIATDITKRRQLENTLRESEERYHSMVEQVEDYSILRLSKEGIVENWNEGAAKIKGYNADEIIGKHFRIFYSKEDQESKYAEKMLEEAAEKGIATDEGWRMKKDGTAFWASMIITALHDSKSSLTGFSIVTHDLTQRKIAEVKLKQISARLKQKTEDLKQNEELFKSVFDNIAEGVAVVNENGNFIIFNKKAEMLSGLNQKDLLNEKLKPEGIYYPDKVTPFPPQETSLFRALRGLDSDDLKTFLKNKNVPEGRFISSNSRPIKNKDGKVVAAVSVFRDISSRMELEKILHDTTLRLEEVMKTIGEGIVICDKDGKFLLFNKKAEEIGGQGATSVTHEDRAARYGLYIADGSRLFQPDELPLVRSIKKGESVRNIEMLVRNPQTGNEKNILINSTPILDEAGNITGAIADFRDITEMRHLENLLNDIRQKYSQLLEVSKVEGKK